MIIENFSYSTDISNPLISLLEHYRKSELPNQDELLLQSAGPITDLAKRSFLPCLDSIRILFFEPQNNEINQQSSALKGNIDLNYNDPLIAVSYTHLTLPTIYSV